jgi:hypothetical protein
LSVLPFRREPRLIAVDVARCRASVRSALPWNLRTFHAETRPLEQALARACDRHLEGKDVETEALDEGLVSHAIMPHDWYDSPTQPWLAPLVDLWVAERGLTFAIDAHVASMEISDGDEWFGEYKPMMGDTAARVPAHWARLREHLAAASDEDYAKARAHAEVIRRKAGAHARSVIAFSFPWEKPWAREAAKSKTRETLQLLGTDLDAKTCAAIIDAQAATESGTIALAIGDGRIETMASLLGDDAVLPLAAILRIRGADWTIPAQLIARIPSEVSADALAPMLDRVDEGAIARTFFGQHPRLALGALASYVTRKPAASRLVRPLLASAIASEHQAACALVKRTPKLKRTFGELGARDPWLDAPLPSVAARFAKWPAVVKWLEHRAPWSERAALDTIDDAAELEAFARVTSSESLPLALAAIDVLAHRPDTLRPIARLATHGLRAEASAHAEVVLRRVQRERGLSDDEIDDVIAPLFVTGALDFGPRRFFARLDEELRATVYDEAGKKIGKLPKPNKKDDAKKAAAAVDAWTSFRDLAANEAREQARRMERAMVSERDYRDESYRATIVEHPILGALARRLLWRAGDGTLFRVAEDGSFANVTDDAFEVRGPFRIVHPIDLDAATRARWSSVFADYEILQPFEQLGRTTFEALPAVRYKPATRAAPFVLENLGWDVMNAYGEQLTVMRELRGARVMVVISGMEDRNIDSVDVVDGRLDRIATSEIGRDLDKILVR